MKAEELSPYFRRMYLCVHETCTRGARYRINGRPFCGTHGAAEALRLAIEESRI